jgi:Spy/CpxP family protein refolding chaperone
MSVDREEAALEPLMEASPLDDSKILPQIDRIAQARADLEKMEARLVLGLRHVLTADQWKLLQSELEPPEPRRQ